MRARVTALLTVLASALGCAPGKRAASDAPANLLLITIDTIRADHCSAYGYARPTTPRLTRLAREGVRFDAAYAPIPSTGPSHATLFTSRQPLGHGVVANGYALGADRALLAEKLMSHGYQTAAVVSSYPLNAKFGYSRGFESYDQEFTEADASIPRPKWDGSPLAEPYDRRGGAATRRATEWLARRRTDRPFLLWVHYFDPHTPYDPPEPFRTTFAAVESSPSPIARDAAAYDGEIAFTDDQMGRLIDAIDAAGLAPTTLVVVVGDHGEGLLSHATLEHGEEVYEEAVRVPLVLRFPGRLAPQRILAPVEMVDVAPTAFELLGVMPPPPEFEGVSVVSALETGRGDMSRRVFLQSELQPKRQGNSYAVRAGRWKYIERHRAGEVRSELFDLATDPGERTDLSAGRPEEVSRLRTEVRAWRRRHDRPPAPPRLTDEDREALRALGYVQ